MDGGDGDIGADAELAVLLGFYLEQSGDLARGTAGLRWVARGVKFCADGEFCRRIPFVAFGCFRAGVDAMECDVAMDVGLAGGLNAPVEGALHGGNGSGENHGTEGDGTILCTLRIYLQADLCAVDCGGRPVALVGVLFGNQARAV